MSVNWACQHAKGFEPLHLQRINQYDLHAGIEHEHYLCSPPNVSAVNCHIIDSKFFGRMFAHGKISQLATALAEGGAWPVAFIGSCPFLSLNRTVDREDIDKVSFPTD